MPVGKPTSQRRTLCWITSIPRSPSPLVAADPQVTPRAPLLIGGSALDAEADFQKVTLVTLGPLGNVCTHMTHLTAGHVPAASHIGCEDTVTTRTGQQSADGPLLATEPEFNAKVVTPVLVDVRPLMSRMPPSMRPGSAKMIFPTSATLRCHRLEQPMQEARRAAAELLALV